MTPQQQQAIERDPLAWLITAVGGTSKPRPKTAALRRAERKGRKTSQRARAHQAAICQRLGKPTPFQKGVRQ
jgi:hypothetical protein